MKKSNIIIISFLVLSISSLFGFFIWVKNHPFLPYTADVPLGEFSVVQVTNCKDMRFRNLDIFIVPTDSANYVRVVADSVIDINPYIFTAGDTLFIQNLAPKNGFARISRKQDYRIYVNHRIKLLTAKHSSIEMSNQVIDTLSFTAVLSDSSSVSIATDREFESEFASVREVNVWAKEHSYFSIGRTSIAHTNYESENSSVSIGSTIQKFNGSVIYSKSDN